MLKHLWLLFAQIVTALLAVLFIVSTFKPQWLDGSGFTSFGHWGGSGTITIKESHVDPSTPNPGSHHEAAKKAMPSVVNIFTSKNAPKAKKKNKALWERCKKDAVSKMGGKWSARAAQYATLLYKKRGGKMRIDECQKYNIKNNNK